METGIHNTSEIGRLKKVLLHRPGKELENLMPEYLERLLFDDIPYLRIAQEEHDSFADILRQNDVEVVYLSDLVEESIINEDIGERNCRFHFMLHEFEGILFSEPNTFHLIANDGIVGEIQRIRNDFETPEHINNSPETAPSKRLEALIPGYAKVKNGTQLSEAMGLGAIMAQCPHFKKWIEDMVAW